MNESTGIPPLLARPDVIALFIVIAGLVLARLASLATASILGIVDRRTARLSTTDASLISPRVIRAARRFAFWAVVFLAVSFALRVYGVGGATTALNAVHEFVPRLLIAFTVVLGGHLLGVAAAHLAAKLDDAMTPESVGPRLLYWSILTVSVIIGVQQIHIDVSLISQLLLIVVGTTSAGLMLAFALGARQHVANLLARRELERLTVGQRVRIDGFDGTVVDIFDTGFDVAGDEGTRWFPAARLAEEGVLRLAEVDTDV